MAEHSSIEWTADSDGRPGATFNPWLGCAKLSPACANCYAETWAKRTGHAALWDGERRRTSEAYWRQPLKWNHKAAAEGRRIKVFCASLADVFDNQVPGAWRCDLWDLIYYTPHLDWLLLTKRPQNIAKMLPLKAHGALADWGDGWPNVWLGTTGEDRDRYRQRWPHLADIPARVRFLSYEPALGSMGDLHLRCAGSPDWVIVGGESGPNARPMHPQWARDVRDQCVAAGVPYFFKQWGGAGRQFAKQTVRSKQRELLRRGRFGRTIPSRFSGEASAMETFFASARSAPAPCSMASCGGRCRRERRR